MRISNGVTPEERVAMRIKTIIEDLNLDLDQTGIMLARVLPHLTYNRLVTMIESAQYEKEGILDPNLQESGGEVDFGKIASILSQINTDALELEDVGYLPSDFWKDLEDGLGLADFVEGGWAEPTEAGKSQL